MGSSQRVAADKPLSFAAASRALGFGDPVNGRRLRDLVLAREKKTGREIAIRLESGALRVTITALKREFPTLFKSREYAMEKRLERIVRDLDDRIERVAMSAAESFTGPALQSTRTLILSDLAKLRADVELAAGIVNEFDQRLALLEQRQPTDVNEFQGKNGEGRE